MTRGMYRVLAMVMLSAAMLLLPAAAIGALAGPGGDDGVEETDAANERSEQTQKNEQPRGPQRVVVRVNRHREVAGTVELEDDGVIVVRTQRGEVQTFVKSRVLKVIRLVEPEPGQRGIVLLRDGQIREGVILEDTYEHVLVEIEGVRAKLLREIVDSVELEPTFGERYQQMLDSVVPQQRERYLIFCRWLIQERRYDLAKAHLIELLEQLEPDTREYPEAARLKRLVDAQLALIDDSSEGGPHEDGARPPRESALDREHLISHEEVNLIRVYEIDFDRPPRVTVDPETIRRLVREYGTNPLIPASKTERDALFRADPLDIARLVFQLRAREIYGEVQVHTEPYAMNLFRERVHNRWLLHNCATSGCHGGPDAGRFALYRQGYRHDRVRYTNFLILERLDLGGEWPLINYEDPPMSLIIQYGLPTSHARLPHPEVRGWRPAFRSMDDRMVQDAIHWIRSMMDPRPSYAVEFDPNELLPADAPSGDDPHAPRERPFGDEQPDEGRQPR